MGFDLKPGECSLHVIKSSSKNPQEGRGKRAPRGSFPTGPGAGFDAATSLCWSIPEIAIIALDGQPSTPTDHEARVRAILGKGQSRELTITCPFEPESIIVDPDARVLQLQRKSAFVKF
jgi:hypothetical protein